MAFRAAFLLLFLLSSGCLPGRLETLPEPSFSLHEARPPAAPGERLTLQRCLDIARTQNPQVVLARLARESARAALRQNLFQLGPVLKLTGRAAEYSTPQRVAPVSSASAGTAVSTGELATWDASLSWNVFAFGRDAHNIAAARHGLDAAGQDDLHTLRTVQAAVIESYAQALAQSAAAQVLENSARALEEQAARMQALAEQDKASALDVDAVRVRAAAVRDQARQAQSQAELSRLRLFFLLGTPPVPAELEPLPETAPPIPDASSLKWKEILARRPDLKAARARFRAQAERVRAMEAEFWPALSLVASWEQRLDISEWPVPPERLHGAGYFGLEVSWNVFESGRMWQSLSQERIKLAVLKQQLRQMELSAVQEILQMHEALRAESERLQTARRTLELADRILQVQRQKLEQGQITFTEYRLMEADAQDARLRVLQTAFQVYVLSAQLAVAMGNSP